MHLAEQRVQGLRTQRRLAELPPPDQAILRYVIKLTEHPGGIERADIDELRQHGFDDRAIHDICAITGYFAFVNRIADGLGVDLEADRDASDSRS